MPNFKSIAQKLRPWEGEVWNSTCQFKSTYVYHSILLNDYSLVSYAHFAPQCFALLRFVRSANSLELADFATRYVNNVNNYLWQRQNCLLPASREWVIWCILSGSSDCKRFTCSADTLYPAHCVRTHCIAKIMSSLGTNCVVNCLHDLGEKVFTR